eukprot:CAMPEP_0114493078 /NCGR_PEP_ID=MMETSP0109-20121206/3913_1 /TAXON_ID=29199 /ORGANISM="Chlorarachnion reptans, Strain CCCM449" /LENGTH=313 /DNA_ID=CAMNT_0001669997 /DNA_START=145 /DNA_END=1086 /DNA_ORIENTATION=-
MDEDSSSASSSEEEKRRRAKKKAKKRTKKRRERERSRREEQQKKPKEWTERAIKIREAILKLPGNTECGDCSTKYPDWASINLGVMICTECAGIHRGLGVHISKVRSIEMDVWHEDQLVFFYKLGGNMKVNKHWEASLKKGAKPTGYDNRMTREFIKQKYANKSFLPKENGGDDDSEEDDDGDSEKEDDKEERRRKKKAKKKEKKKRKDKKKKKKRDELEDEDNVEGTTEVCRREEKAAASSSMNQMSQVFEGLDVQEVEARPAQETEAQSAQETLKSKGETTEEDMLKNFFAEEDDGEDEQAAADAMDALFR